MEKEELKSATTGEEQEISDIDAQDLELKTNVIENLENNIPGVTKEKMKERFDFLKRLGFKNVYKMAEKYPYHIFQSKDEAIEKTISTLKDEIGVDDPISVLSRQPQLLRVADEKMKERFDFLKELGFKNPVDMVRKMPGILGYKKEVIAEKIKFLEESGINHPLIIIETVPAILTMKKESIKQKIDTIRSAFSDLDPSDLIMKFKAILSYSPENIIRKKKFIDKIIDLYKAPITSEELVNYFPQILSYSTDRIVITVRIIKHYGVSIADELKRGITTILTQNIEHLLVAFAHEQDIKSHSINDLRKRIKFVKELGLTKEQEQSIIDKDLKDEKIKRKYQKK